MEAITQAIRHAAEAGKLRAFVRKNGSGLQGLERLADRHSSAATTALDEICRSAAAEPVARFAVRRWPI
jgi:hypothetical protein